MTTTKHTQGPWRVRPGTCNEVWTAPGGIYSQKVAWIATDPGTDPDRFWSEAAANARLIAAAPMLLTACQEWLHFYDELMAEAEYMKDDARIRVIRDNHGERAERTRAAIAAATGDSEE